MGSSPSIYTLPPPAGFGRQSLELGRIVTDLLISHSCSRACARISARELRPRIGAETASIRVPPTVPTLWFFSYADVPF